MEFRGGSWKYRKGEWYKEYERQHLERRKWLSNIVLDSNPDSIMELGCSGGANLDWIYKNGKYNNQRLIGIEINSNPHRYIKEFKKYIEPYNLDITVDELPKSDLIFTMGCLIHINQDKIEYVCQQIINCSNKFILVEEHGPYKQTHKEIYQATYDYINIFSRLNYSVKIDKLPKFKDTDSSLMLIQSV